MATVLVIDNFKIFEKWASKTYQYKIDTLRKDTRFKIIDIDEIKTINFNDFKTIIFGWNLCMYSKYYTLKQTFYSKKIQNLETFSDIMIKTKEILKHKRKYLIIQDFINNDDYQKGVQSLILYLNKYKFKGIITPYLNTPACIPLKNELPEIEIIHAPHHIDSSKFKDWELEKEYDIFIFGNCKSNRYPFRNRILKILEMNKDNYKICFWNDLMSRNYFKFNDKISNENLSKQINKSWLTVCTKSYADVLLGKYFETSMSKSCVLGNMPTDGIKIWKDNYINIEEDMTDEEIIKTIKIALNNKETLSNHIDIIENKMKQFYLDKFPDRIYYGLR